MFLEPVVLVRIQNRWPLASRGPPVVPRGPPWSPVAPRGPPWSPVVPRCLPVPIPLFLSHCSYPTIPIQLFLPLTVLWHQYYGTSAMLRVSWYQYHGISIMVLVRGLPWPHLPPRV